MKNSLALPLCALVLASCAHDIKDEASSGQSNTIGDEKSVTYQIDVGHGKSMNVVFRYECQMVNSLPVLVGTDTGYGFKGEVKYTTATKALVLHKVAKTCEDLSGLHLTISDLISLGDSSTNTVLYPKAIAVYQYFINPDDIGAASRLGLQEKSIVSAAFNDKALGSGSKQVMAMHVSDRNISLMIDDDPDNGDKAWYDITLKLDDEGGIIEYDVKKDIGQYL